MPKNYSQLTMSHPRTFLLGIQNKSSEAFQWIFNFERSDFRMKKSQNSWHTLHYENASAFETQNALIVIELLPPQELCRIKPKG